MFTKGLHAGFRGWQTSLAQPVSWLLLVVVLYVFLAPNVDFAKQLAWHDGQRIAQLVLLGVFLTGFVLPGVVVSIVASWAAIPRWSRLAICAAFTLGIGSSLQAPLSRWAFLEWAMSLLLLFVVLGVAAGIRAGGQALQRFLVLMFYATAAAYTVKAVVVYITMLTVGTSYGMEFNIRELFTGFSNIRFFGHLQTMLLPFLLLPSLWWAKTLRQRVLLGGVPALWWMLVVASETRGTWIALLAGVFAVMVFGGRTGQRWIKWQIAGLGCGLACYGVFVFLVPYLLEQPLSFLPRTEDITSLSSREVIWSAATSFTGANPLFGIGPMHFAYYANTVAAHPHNLILQLMAEWGLPAAVLFTTVFVSGGVTFAWRVKYALVQNDGREDSLIWIALLAALTGAVAQAMVDGVFVMPVSQILLALLCGWALGISHPAAGMKYVVSRTSLLLLTFLAVFAAGAVIYGVAPEIGHLVERQEAYLAVRDPLTRLLPRFWTLGWIDH